MSEKKNFMDFIKDETKKSVHRGEFVTKVDEKGTTAKALCELLHGWGYDGVSVSDCETVLLFCHAQGLTAHKLEPRY